MKLFATIAVSSLTALALPLAVQAQCQSDTQVRKASMTKESSTIVETAVSAGSFKTLVTAVKAAHLVDALSGKGPFTVFAPTDEAFSKVDPHTLQALLKPENRGLLTAVLTYHVIPGRLDGSQVSQSSGAATLNGQRLAFKADAHGVRVGSSTVVDANIECSNGIIHVIDRVLLPSQLDIVETAVENGNFKTLATALKAANLIEALQGKGPFTVFAPIDSAFDALPAGTLDTLLGEPGLKKLTSILTYHVIPGRIYAKDAIAAETAVTLQGQSVRIRLVDGEMFIDDRKVIKTDIETKNGVIHVLEGVLLPQAGS